MPLPQDQEVLFLLSEDVRMETGGKVSLLGLYSGNEVVVFGAEGAPPPIIPGLGFFFSILGGEGNFAARFQLVSPDANPIADHEVGQVNKNAAGAVNLMMRFHPFPA